jgi:uncharacterized membrane protein YhaH (DUF805 family)
MRGRILGYNGSDFRGLISGQDGQRYDFVRMDWRGAGEPATGMEVDFRPDAAAARDIFLAAPGVEQPPRPAQAYPPYGQPGQPQPGQPNQGQPGQTYPGPGYAQPSNPQTDMGFGDAISTCFRKYATFTGRARRAEYWYFVLFSTLARLVTTILDAGVGMHSTSGGPFSALLSLGLFIPSLAVLTRRLHDTDRSGFWVLGFYGALFACIIGFVVAALAMSQSYEARSGAMAAMVVLGLVMLGASIWLIVVAATKGTNGPNRYGPDPLFTQADVF